MQAGSRDSMDRRLAAILAADVVGYSRLMEADEERRPGQASRCRQCHGPLVSQPSTAAYLRQTCCGGIAAMLIVYQRIPGQTAPSSISVRLEIDQKSAI